MPASRPAPSPPNTTGYALLGLLSLRPWTTYELAQQVRRSLSWFWPRTERKIYDEPKRLVAAGLATAREEFTGRRRRTVYSITDAGRDRLAQWLRGPSAPPSYESEALVRVFFADAGDLPALRATLTGIEEGARARLAELEEMAAGAHPFPERRHITSLAMRLQQDQERAALEWATWARAEVARWKATDRPG